MTLQTPVPPGNSARPDADRGAASVCAIAVTHQPDLRTLQAMIAAVIPQVGALVVVDNATRLAAFDDLLRSHPEVTVLLQEANNGLACAVNLGIDWARERGYAYVLLLDQDSLPEPTMVPELMRGLRTLSAQGKVAAVGPKFRDSREARDAPFVRIRFPFNRKLYCGRDLSAVNCDFLISSGSLIPMPVFDEIGAMDDELFIDNVDLDWCFRARAGGFRLYGICAASMRHRLGDARRRLPLLPRAIVVHPPLRLYYMMRNRLWLYRRSYTPAAWIAQDIPRAVAKFLLFSLLVTPRARNLGSMLAGLRDGLRGRPRPAR